MDWDKPDSSEDWLARLLVVLLVTTVVGGVVVGGVMFALLDAPKWSLVAATTVILIIVAWLAFAPEFEDEDEPLTWEQKRPVDLNGWLRFAGEAFLAWLAIGMLVNRLILGAWLDASNTVQAIAAVVLIPLSVLLEFFLGESRVKSAAEPAPEHPDERPGLVDA